jgi:hypothetical protein
LLITISIGIPLSTDTVFIHDAAYVTTNFAGSTIVVADMIIENAIVYLPYGTFTVNGELHIRR